MCSQFVSHLQSQTLLLDVRGCTAGSVLCGGVTPAGLPSLYTPPNWDQWATGCHHGTVTGAARAMTRWPGRLLPVSLIVVSRCLLGCGSYSGSAPHMLHNLAKLEHSLGDAFAVRFCCCTSVLPSSLFYYT